WRGGALGRQAAQAAAETSGGGRGGQQAAGRGAQPGQTPPAGGGGFGLNVQGLPLLKPPYGVLNAIDLDKGELKWQGPHGDTPDAVRNHPALKGMNIPKTDFPRRGGPLLTKNPGRPREPAVTTPSEQPRRAMLPAYDKQTGQQVGAVWMPAPQSGSPMTYLANGKQYIIVSISGGNYSGEYLAFSLPASETRTPTQAAPR